MIKKILVVLCIGMLSIGLSAQTLSRQASGKLIIELTDLQLAEIDCSVADDIQITLFEKINISEERTCSKRNTWDKVKTFSHDSREHLVLSARNQGIYKAEIELSFDCENAGKSKITQLFESNTWNDFAESKTTSSIAGPEMLLVYPNPSLDKFVINISHFEDALMEDYELHVMASDGRLLLQKIVTAAESNYYEVNLSDFPAGQYTFSVYQDGLAIGSSKVFKISK